MISISVHEFAHAYTASKLGDNTAKERGRLSLNPLKHIDLIGTVLMPLAAFASGFALIGWAKPVPVDRRNFKNPLKDDTIVSFAGPLSNLILAVLLFSLLKLSGQLIPGNNKLLINIFSRFLRWMVRIYYLIFFRISTRLN